ncbi:MAG: DUF2842 domain-containing protein [Alphaproteobacteria bacterium]
MRRRAKKLIGTTLLIVLVPLYALIVAAVAGTRITEQSTIVQVAFYAFFGLAWILPAGAIIKWMADPRTAGPTQR